MKATEAVRVFKEKFPKYWISSIAKNKDIYYLAVNSSREAYRAGSSLIGDYSVFAVDDQSIRHVSFSDQVIPDLKFHKCQFVNYVIK